LKEYHDAFNAKLPSFTKRFKNVGEIKEVYFYVGGSIRFMCSDVKETISILEREISEVTDNSLILNGLRGDRSSGSVNTLMQMFSSKTIPVSEFVLRKLTDKVGASFITAAKNVNIDNGSWKGWVLELEILSKIKSALSSVELLCIEDNSPVTPWSSQC